MTRRYARMAGTAAGLPNGDGKVLAVGAGCSPAPWRMEEALSGHSRCVVDAGGLEVALCFGEVSHEVDEANARLIVAAVNEWFERNGAGTAAGLQDGDGGK